MLHAVAASGGMNISGEAPKRMSIQSEMGRMRGSLAVLRALRPDCFQGRMPDESLSCPQSLSLHSQPWLKSKECTGNKVF